MVILSWELHRATGFLVNPDPLTHLADVPSPLSPDLIDALEDLADTLPDAIQSGELRTRCDVLPLLEADILRTVSVDVRLYERLQMLYGFFANAYALSEPTVKHLPEPIARPLVEISELMGRPPVLAYSGMVLNNWRRLDPAGDIVPENIETLISFTGTDDEAWFFKVHIAIEARAGEILHALTRAAEAVDMEHERGVLRALRAIQTGLVDITTIFHRMTEGCDPDRYFLDVRPFLFGLTDVVYEGMFDHEPQTYRGGSGAQSSIVPAVLSGLGIQHEHNELTRHLNSLHQYMPPEHRRFIAQLGATRLRDYCADRPPLRDLYNNVLRRLMTFRRAHLYYAKTYIFEKSPTAAGTGGTQFVQFLAKLIDETDAHLL